MESIPGLTTTLTESNTSRAAKFRDGVPEILLTDWRMPGMYV